MNLIDRIFYNWNRGIKRCISLVLCTIIIVTGNFGMITFANTISENETDIYEQELVENISIEGINYIFYYHYNEKGERSISITDMSNSKTEILTYDNIMSNIYLDGEKIGSSNLAEDDWETVSPSAVDTSWKLIGSPVHERVSWAKGTTTAIVAGSIAIFLGISGTHVISAMGMGALSVLAAQAVGGTVHFSRYYRFLAFGEVQYRTDWSFAASTGDRYGTYYYYSVPQPF